MKIVYSFEIHSYAPELNKVFANNINVSRYFSSDFLKSLTKDYIINIRLLRKYISFKTYNHYIFIAYCGEKCGYTKQISGGFNNWNEAIKIIHSLKNWFTTEKPIRKISFLH